MRRALTLSLMLWLGLVAARAQAPLPDGPPRLLSPVEPVYPPRLKEQRIIGSARIGCLIDETGAVREAAVESASQPEFGLAALEAVRKFHYQPAVKNGQARALRVSIPVEFGLRESELAELEARRVKETLPPGPPPLTAAEVDVLPDVRREIRPETPVTLVQSRQLGQAMIGLVVDEQGLPRDVHPIVATHAECAIAALEVVRQWKFSPASKDGKAVRVSLEVPVVFFPENSSANGARVRPGVGITLGTEAVRRAEAAEGGNFAPPRIRKQQPVEFPAEMSRRGLVGRVVVEFIIGPRGAVTHVRAMDKTNVFFAALAERAVSHWTFHPAQKDGVAVECYVRQLIEFRY